MYVCACVCFRCVLTLWFPLRSWAKHKLHLSQWKYFSLGPILLAQHSDSDGDVRLVSVKNRPRGYTTCSPTDTTGQTVVLLLVPVKQVTHVAVVLPKLQVALLASLLHLKHQQTVL